MKKLFTLLLAALTGVSALAQDQFLLFPEFVRGHMVFSNNATTDVLLNFDALHQKIYYVQGDKLMEMTNMASLRTLTAEDRHFVMHDGLFCEVLEQDGEQTLVNWKFRNINKGSKGALGSVTHNKVEVLWTNMDAGIRVNGAGTAFQAGEHYLEVWTRKNDNTYFFEIDGTPCRAKRLKDLYTAFPSVAPDLKAYVKAEKLSMENADSALKILHQLRILLGAAE